MVKKTSKFRSGLEEAIADELDKLNVDYGYEDMVISYLKPARKTRYTPDFTIKVNGEIWESKGRFQTADRKKHLLIKEQHPNIKIKFIFSNSKNKIGKKSKTTYAKWCELKGFEYHCIQSTKQLFPMEWINGKKGNRLHRYTL